MSNKGVHSETSQYSLILKHLQIYHETTPAEAYAKYGVYRLGAIILYLRRDGYNIVTYYDHHINKHGRRMHFARYRLEDKNGGI